AVRQVDPCQRGQHCRDQKTLGIADHELAPFFGRDMDILPAKPVSISKIRRASKSNFPRSPCRFFAISPGPPARRSNEECEGSVIPCLKNSRSSCILQATISGARDENHPLRDLSGERWAAQLPFCAPGHGQWPYRRRRGDPRMARKNG